MALTRAQLLSGNNNNGFTLPGQPQGVIAGPGISISNTGIISVDSSSVTGLVKLNDPFAYNSYVWPGADGTAGEFLQTDGAGNLDWATPQGFAVVTVSNFAPVPSDVGELWFDCSSGTLNVYQDCVGGTGWFNVAQPGFPVLPGSTSALPPFANQGTPGAGTQANPYDCTVTTVPSGSSTFIVNTVTVNGLAPFQYVPIVDLNAVANLGRFSFSNYYANSSGVLTFQVIFKDLPPSGGGISYTAAIRVGYASAYIEAVVNTTLPLTLSGGNIAGTPTSGTPVAFTPPTASGGSGGYTYAYQWFADGAIIPLATSATFTPTTAEVGKTLSVTTTVTDSSGATASTTTTASSQTAGSPISNWAATGSMTTIPGGLSGVYTGTGTNITVTGCIESAVYTPPAVPTFNNSAKPITSGQTLAIRWSTSPSCGGGPTSTTPITGTLTDGVGTNSYSVVVNRIPTPAINDITDTNVALNGTVSEGIATPITGLTTTAYVTYVGTSTGGTIGASLTPGGPFTPLATSGQGFQINNLQTLYIQQTAGGTVNTAPGYTAVIRVGDGTNTAGTYDEFTYFAQTVSTAVFPSFNPTPAGGPNASPAATNFTDTGSLGLLDGTASGSWGDAGPAVTGTNLLLSIGVGSTAFTTSVSPVNGNTVNFCWEPTYLAGLADQATATGSFTNGTYTNTYSFKVEKNPVYTVIPSDSSSFSPNAPITIPQATPDNFNCPVKLYYTPGPNTLSNVQVDINGNGVQSLPSSPGAALTLNPGESVEFFADMGPNVGTQYSITINMGAFSGVWAETCVAAPAVGQPAIDGPNGTTLNPALNSPAGLTITTPASGAGSFIPSGTAGTNHASSNWEVYKGSYPLISTNTIGSVNTTTPSAWSIGAVPPSGPVGSIQYAPVLGKFFLLGMTMGPNAMAYSSTNGNIFTLDSQITTGIQPNRSAVSPTSILVQAGGDIYRSTNATAWNIVSNTAGTNDLQYLNGMYVALRDNTIRYSTNDGVTWTPNITLPANGFRIRYANGVYLVSRSDGTGYMYSTNLTSWVSYPLTNIDISGLDTVANKFVFFQLGGSASYKVSSDGLTWTSHTFPETMSGETYSSQFTTTFGAISTTTSALNPKFYTTPDAIAWVAESVNVSATGPLRSIATDGTKYVTYGGVPYYTGTTPFTTTALTIAGCATDGFLAGDTIVSNSPAGAGPSGILSLDNTTVTISGPAGSWASPQKIERATSSYTQIVPPPANPNTTSLANLFLAQSSLAVSSTYYARVAFTSGTDPGGTGVVVTSPWSTWHSFGTASSFLIPPGTPMGGGYFAGQIVGAGSTTGGGLDDLGVIYNLIVAPVTGTGTQQGQYGGATPTGVQYRNPALADTNPNSQNANFGKLATEQFAAATHPMFDWCVNGANGPRSSGGIGGYSDWYIPAKNELEVLYYFLKPDLPVGGNVNDTSSGSNPQAVSPEPVSTNYTTTNPAQTTANGTGGRGDFRTGGSQAFSNTSSYWSSTESTPTTGNAWRQAFGGGIQSTNGKATNLLARAIRRIAA